MAREGTDTGATGKRQAPTPPRMTKAEWARRDKTSVSLTRNELEHLAQMVAMGRQVLRDSRKIPAKLKAAMTRMGVSTHGL